MDYVVKSIGKTCEKSGRELEPGELCHSVLREEHGDKVRYDYSTDGWTQLSDEEREVFSHWITTVPVQKAEDGPRPLEPEQLFEFFEQMLEDMNPAQEQIKYVLALLLMQKKRLRMEGIRDEEGVSYLTLSGSQGEGPYDIREQQLSDEEIARLQQELSSAIYR
jgi:hypothetical protein